MVCSYEEYLESNKSLSIEKMQQIHSEMLTEIEMDADALELYEDLICISTKYASIRAGWLQMSKAEKADKDSLRTSYHDSVITHLNMLSRYLKMHGKSASWRDRLGYEEDDRYFRKTMGDFACYLVFINSINAR